MTGTIKLLRWVLALAVLCVCTRAHAQSAPEESPSDSNVQTCAQDGPLQVLKTQATKQFIYKSFVLGNFNDALRAANMNLKEISDCADVAGKLLTSGKPVPPGLNHLTEEYTDLVFLLAMLSPSLPVDLDKDTFPACKKVRDSGIIDLASSFIDASTSNPSTARTVKVNDVMPYSDAVSDLLACSGEAQKHGLAGARASLLNLVLAINELRAIAEINDRVGSPPMVTSSAPASAAAPDTMPARLGPCASLQPSEVPPTVISFAIADQGGVHQGVMAWTRNWVNKNANKFPGVLFQDCPVQGAKNYLIVFSASANVLSGFDPVVRTTTSTNTSPVSGSGTLSDSYGSEWEFTFSGYVTTTTTTTTRENVPYTVQSNTLYASAYEEHGSMISRRWHVFNTKQGGDPADSIGYNLASTLFAVNARGRLLNAVVKDIARTKKK